MSVFDKISSEDHFIYTLDINMDYLSNKLTDKKLAKNIYDLILDNI